VSWSEVPLGELSRIKTGKLDANASSLDGAYPFFTCAKEPLRIASYSYDCECVLVAGNGDLNVKHYSGKFDAYQRTYIIESADPERLNVRYLFHFMDQYLDVLREQSIGGIIKYIKMGNLTEAPIPLPPLPEQRRIAAILDKADALRAKRRLAIAKLDQLLQSVFLEMFGDPVTNPKGWPIHLLREAAFFQEGPGILAKDFRDDGVPLVRLSGVKDSDHVSLLGCNYLDPKMVETKWAHFRLAKGDIVILTSASLGHAAIVGEEAEGAIPYTGMIRLRPETDELTSGFLKTYLTSPWFSRQAQAMASGAVIKHFGPTHMKQMTLPMPPRSVQEQYADVAEKVSEQRVHLVATEQSNELLFQSLQRDAFSGISMRAG